MLLDTTFFIDLEREILERKPGPCRAWLESHRHLIKHVSVVSLGEFAAGASASATLKFFRGYQRIALGRDLAIFGGRLQATLDFEIGENDLWIAATAKFYGLTLASRDQIFPRIPGLQVEAY